MERWAPGEWEAIGDLCREYGIDLLLLAECETQSRAGRAGQIDPSQAASAGMRIQNPMDAWERVADNVAQAGGSLGYGRAGVARLLLHEVLETGLRQDEAAFRAGRSLRDVEPGVLVEIIE